MVALEWYVMEWSNNESYFDEKWFDRACDLCKEDEKKCGMCFLQARERSHGGNKSSLIQDQVVCSDITKARAISKKKTQPRRMSWS